MYHHSPQTFLSLTAQRARHSAAAAALYGTSASAQASAPDGKDTASGQDKLIRFTELDDAAVGRIWADLRRSLGEH
jgi:hypothetical protein